MCYIFRDDKELKENCNKQLKNALVERGLKYTVIKVGESYNALEKLAETKRADLEFGKDQLFEAFEYFVRGDIKKEKKLGVCLLTITQMVCEPLRIAALKVYMLKYFERGYKIPEMLLMLEHMWSVASKLLQLGEELDFELYLYDDEDEKVSFTELYGTFGILKRFAVDFHGYKVEEFDKIVLQKYLHACFGKYIKRLDRVQLGMDHKVNTIVHILDRYLVFQYNYSNFFNKVTLSVDAPETFRLADFQLKTVPCKSFVAFEIVGDVPMLSTFSTAFCGKAQDGRWVVLQLEDLEVHGTDFLRGAGLNDFNKNWEECAFFTADSEKALAQSLSLEEAKDVATKFLCLKDVTSHGDRSQKRNKGLTLMHGMYMKSSRVLVKAEYLPKGDAVVEMIKFSARCDTQSTLVFIRNILQEWEILHCIHC